MVDASYIASAVSALGPSLSGLDIESNKEIEAWEERINTNQGEVSDLKVSKDWRCAIEDIAGRTKRNFAYRRLMAINFVPVD